MAGFLPDRVSSTGAKSPESSRVFDVSELVAGNGTGGNTREDDGLGDGDDAALVVGGTVFLNLSPAYLRRLGGGEESSLLQTEMSASEPLSPVGALRFLGLVS